MDWYFSHTKSVPIDRTPQLLVMWDSSQALECLTYQSWQIFPEERKSEAQCLVSSIIQGFMLSLSLSHTQEEGNEFCLFKKNVRERFLKCICVYKFMLKATILLNFRFCSTYWIIKSNYYSLLRNILQHSCSWKYLATFHLYNFTFCFQCRMLCFANRNVFLHPYV